MFRSQREIGEVAMTIEAGLDINAFHVDPFWWDRYKDGKPPEAYHQIEAGEAERPQNTWLKVPYCTTGDYCGSGAVGEANRRTMTELLESIDPDGERWTELTAAHSTRCLFVRADIDELEDGEQITEALASLANYPILDEQEWSEVEEEWKQEAWSDWARDDYQRELCKRFDDHEEHIDELDATRLDTLWWDHVESQDHCVWADENAYRTMYCDTRRGAELTPLVAIRSAIVAQAHAEA
jgi:hypothetical protein